MNLRFDSWGVTDTGYVRELNEDRYLELADGGVWLVADGMGGHEGGEIASSSIVDHVGSIGIASSCEDLQARFVDRICRANQEIQNISDRRNGAVIGSTVVALLAHGGKFACLWSGDSRLYLIRNGQLLRVSRDHTEAEDLLEKGVISAVEAETWPRRNVITQAIGVSETPVIDAQYGTLEPDDCFVLCSDGLNAHVDDGEILAMVNGRKTRDACELLVEKTLERGASDNVTVIVVRCRRDGTEVPRGRIGD